MAEIGSDKIGTAQTGEAKARPRRGNFPQICRRQFCPGQIRGAEMSLLQDGGVQVCAFQIGLSS